jgi:hypothetical protein
MPLGTIILIIAFLLYLLVGGTVLYALNLLALRLWFDPPSSAAVPVVVQPDPQNLSAQFP